MSKLTIVRSRWCRGQGEDSLLLTPSNTLCCLGFFAEHHGIEKNSLRNIGDPAELPFDDREAMPEWLFKDVDLWENSDDCNKLIEINDEKQMPEELREKLLTEHFAKHGVEVVFEG